MTNRLQITAITTAYPEGAWYLDRPGMQPPATGETSIYLELAGWLVSTTPDPVHAIAIYAPNLYRSPLLVTILHPRQDVSHAMGLPPDTPTGFHAHLNILGLHRIGAIELRAVTLGAWDAFIADSSYNATALQPIATIHFTTQASPTQAPHPTPLFVTSLGRSGSTCIMAALATSTDIIAPEAYPFETKPLAYALHMARLAISPAIPHLPIASQRFLDVPFVGSTNPNLHHTDYPSLFQHYRHHGLAIFRTQVAADLHAHLPTQPATPGSPQPRYIAEKSAPNTLTPMLAELVWPQSTEFILCRDVTPWIASALSFSRATDRYFGDRPDLATIIPQLTTDLAAFLDYLVLRAPHAKCIRFETLINDPTFPDRLCEHLTLPSAAATLMAASIRTIPPSHRTTHTPNDPVLAQILASPTIQRLITRYTDVTTDPATIFI
jgi:hypothetical protein